MKEIISSIIMLFNYICSILCLYHTFTILDKYCCKNTKEY